MDGNIHLQVKGRYRLLRKIGSGGGGAVYEGIDDVNDIPVAIKLAPLESDGTPKLTTEIALYNVLEKKSGLPRIHWSGIEGDFHAIVFELLGPSIEDLFNFCGRRFTMKTVLLLVEQLIRRLAYLHSMEVIHRDVKPENFLTGLGTQGNRIYVTDLGLGARFRSIDSGAVSPIFPPEPKLHGTEIFASVRGHWGVAQCPSDDMESLGYMMIYLARGSLPWQGLQIPERGERLKQMLSMKESITPEDLCEGLPEEFTRYFTHIQSVDFDDMPNYTYLRRLFGSLFKRMGYERNFVYDWTILLFLISEEKEKQGIKEERSQIPMKRKRKNE